MQYLKKISMSFVILMLALMLDSCSTKQAAINDLQRLSYDLRDNSRNYTVRSGVELPTGLSRYASGFQNTTTRLLNGRR